jgi:hypothetical protein
VQPICLPDKNASLNDGDMGKVSYLEIYFYLMSLKNLKKKLSSSPAMETPG